ncbi:hypothetical protein NDU88_005884 [Pleurodeles waltl]|uniref:Uncharacterized protein n=1 Tax=Pleurodeles waltl TaxID=8319 RepID=A0AAV7VMZ2_PLEWA|nr:hypothetical protein NDU88_005884 [Pleurodeles waltl]
MEDHGSPTLFSPEENQEEADIWTKFMAMGQAKGLEWAKMMVAAHGVQQPLETPAPTNTDEVQPSDSGLCILSDESVATPAKRKRPARAAAGSKLKRAKKDMADSNLPEGPSTSQMDSRPRRARKDHEEQEAARAGGLPLAARGLAPGASAPIAQEQISQPARSVACSPTLGASGQGLQVGLGKMMEAIHSFMASAKALAGLGMDEQGASSRRAGAGQVWGRDTNSAPTVQGEASALGAEVSDRVAPDTPAGGSDKATVVRPDPPPCCITVPSKEVEKHKWKKKVKPEESIDNWLEAFVMLSTVIMEKFLEHGLALCKYNRVIYEENTRIGGTGWLNYDQEFRQKMEQAPEMAWDCREIELWVQSSELVAKAKGDTSYRALRWGDLNMGQDMVELRVRRSKTDQKGKGVVVVRLRGLGDPKCCPVELLRRYTACLPAQPGYLLLHQDGQPITQFQ